MAQVTRFRTPKGYERLPSTYEAWQCDGEQYDDDSGVTIIIKWYYYYIYYYVMGVITEYETMQKSKLYEDET